MSALDGYDSGESTTVNTYEIAPGSEVVVRDPLGNEMRFTVREASWGHSSLEFRARYAEWRTGTATSPHRALLGVSASLHAPVLADDDGHYMEMRRGNGG